MQNHGLLPPKLELGAVKDLSLCYGCGKKNPIGLKLNFSWDGNIARAGFNPNQYHQGWPGIVHGGIICTLLDEAMGYVTYFMGLHCVTAKFEMRIRSVVPITEKLTITGSVLENSKRLLKIGASVVSSTGFIVAEGTGLMYIIKR